MKKKTLSYADETAIKSFLAGSPAGYADKAFAKSAFVGIASSALLDIESCQSGSAWPTTLFTIIHSSVTSVDRIACVGLFSLTGFKFNPKRWASRI